MTILDDIGSIFSGAATNTVNATVDNAANDLETVGAEWIGIIALAFLAYTYLLLHYK